MLFDCHLENIVSLPKDTGMDTLQRQQKKASPYFCVFVVLASLPFYIICTNVPSMPDYGEFSEVHTKNEPNGMTKIQNGNCIPSLANVQR